MKTKTLLISAAAAAAIVGGGAATAGAATGGVHSNPHSTISVTPTGESPDLGSVHNAEAKELSDAPVVIGGSGVTGGIHSVPHAPVSVTPTDGTPDLGSVHKGEAKELSDAPVVVGDEGVTGSPVTGESGTSGPGTILSEQGKAHSLGKDGVVVTDGSVKVSEVK